MTAPLEPPNATDVRALIDQRLDALRDTTAGLGETTTVEWRGAQRVLPVVQMPVALLSYNPHTHRVRAQRTLDLERDRLVVTDPFVADSQAYLHQLLRGDPADPGTIDPTFELLKDDLKQHGQSDPGIISRSGVLINGNTRRAALNEIGAETIRVGVLPADAGLEDLQSIELSLQLRREHKREYSFMNFLLALDERLEAGRPPEEICSAFRIRKQTLERNRWILAFVREAIERSSVTGAGGKQLSMRLADFEAHKGKLEELYTAYIGLKAKAPGEAEALREQRMLAIALGKSKTDVRLIGADFTDTYMKHVLPPPSDTTTAGVSIPGTNITVDPPSSKVVSLRDLTDKVLHAKAVEIAPSEATPTELTKANTALQDLDGALNDALTQAGKQGRVIKRRFGAVDRLSDANDDVELAIRAVAEARETGNFDVGDLDEQLLALKRNLTKLAQVASRGQQDSSGGLTWLRDAANLPDPEL